jgi:hypothetical protein
LTAIKGSSLLHRLVGLAAGPRVAYRNQEV